MKKKFPTSSSSSLSRRDFLKKSGLGMAAIGSFGAAPIATSASTRKATAATAKGRAKNIIFLVSDGMSAGTFAMADQFLLWKEGRHSHWGDIYQRGEGRFSIMDTASRNNRVTDSAAAASAWGCGQRVDNGRVNVGPDETPHKTILEIARDSGKSTGLVTTATVTHATPAGFGANVQSRRDERIIMEQYLERDYDLLLGGGLQLLKSTDDQPSLQPKVEAGGYEFIRTRDELLDSQGSDPRLIGLFAEEFIPYEVDRIHSPEQLYKTVPSLAEMAVAALKRLSTNPNGFVLQIEGARVDHAAHLNDTGGLLYDQIAFDEAVGEALKFASEHDDTLIIVTTDHGNASTGMSSGENLGRRNFNRVDAIRGSFRTLRDRLDRNQSLEEIQKHVANVLGTEISKEHADFILRHMNSEYAPPYRRMEWLAATIGQVMANYNDFGWIGNAHTAEYVYLNALGPGCELIQPFTKNYELFNVMVEAAGMGRWV